MSNSYNRRDILKLGGMLAISAPFSRLIASENATRIPLEIPENPLFKKPGNPITAVVMGAGNRGNVYSGYSQKYPDEVKIVGVAEPIEERRKVFSEKYNIPKEHQWTTWEDVLKVSKFADALIITTPDHLHYGPAMSGLAMGYDMLLEKPIAQTWKECNDILKLTQEKKRIVAICHVLRYTPYFRKMKEIVESGQIGDIVSMQHFEPVQHIHMSHSYVRGNWRNTKESNFMLLAKSCHDMDILRWVINKPCKRVTSFGSLKYFKKENAPAGSTMRCTDGCKVESTCPFSALRIYYRKRTWLGHLFLPKDGDQGEIIMQRLKEGPYGRCVFHCDNDVVDHQVVSMEFEDGITSTFQMEAFTNYAGRRTRIMGTKGDIVGDEKDLIHYDFSTEKEVVYDTSKLLKDQSGHGGGDYGLMRDLVQAISQRDPKLLTSTIEASMESHLMAFRAEEARLQGSVLEVKL
jgi:predicted dehydrogenase